MNEIKEAWLQGYEEGLNEAKDEFMRVLGRLSMKGDKENAVKQYEESCRRSLGKIGR